MIRRLAFLMIFVLAASFAAAQQKGGAQKKNSDKKGPDTAKAQVIFKENCAVCHWPDKTEKRIGPGLKGLFQREKLSDGRPVNEENVRDIILKGSDKMLPFAEKLDAKQVDALIAYLKTL